MAAGKIKKIVSEKGFGFIRPDGGGDDVFFHFSALVDVSIEDLGLGDHVQFDIEEGREGKGPRALNIKRL